MSQQLWGSRFGVNAGKINLTFAEFNSSISLDRRLYADDIDASKAYAEALSLAGYLTPIECEQICKGLELVRYDWIEGLMKILPTDEDVHTINERRLTELIGEIGQRLHTGRSRNDQVATDLKLWMRKAIRETIKSLRNVIEAIVCSANQHIAVIMPGYTHLQRAQPVKFSHWLLSHAFALKEDCKRLIELRERMNSLPLGSGALAGNSLGIDREWLAKRLGFKNVTQNSMHAVGDRDFAVDFIYCSSLIGLHLSRLAEDMIIFSTYEFNFIEISDQYATGSSLMPQKRNPDSLELIRGASAQICAALTGIMITIKGTPSTYNKDLQYDKKYCFETFDLLQQILDVTAGVITTLKVKSYAMEKSLSFDMMATEWVYYLVRKGVPFRRAHHYIGEVISYAESSGTELAGIPLGKLQEICPYFDIGIAKVVDHADNVETYNVTGGTATNSIQQQMHTIRKYIEELKKYE